MNKIETALAHATDTKALEIGRRIVSAPGAMFASQFPGRRAIIIADPNTWAVAGEQVYKSLDNAGIEQDEPYIFDSDVYASWEWVEKLDCVLAATDAIPVAVSSGTINDLTKLSSHRQGRRYMVVATAASMDGYTAFGASITFDGAKQTFSCPAPQAVLADIDIIADAPAPMTTSGYADLFAKIPAGADWILSDALGVEPIDELAFSLVQDNLKDALKDTNGILKGERINIERLTEGLIFSGFAMQAHKSSRPASGADHQFSHLWDMEHHTLENGVAPSHGFKVSIGLLASLALYEELLRSDMKNLDVEACVRAWPELKEVEHTALDLFRDTDFPTIGTTEYGAKYIGRNELRVQLETLKTNWEDISRSLRSQLIPFDTAVDMLNAVGAPTLPEHINISRQRLRDSYSRALYIRRRFTILDVADRCGCMERWLDNIFGRGRLWEI